MNMTCILCATDRVNVFCREEVRRYFRCSNCDIIFLDPKYRLSACEEFARYKYHENNVENLGYQGFVTPLLEMIKTRVPKGAQLLDFGCGDGPVLGHLLEKEDFRVEYYDPYFRNQPDALKKHYDLVFAVEVAEHFYSPREEFQRLKTLLKPVGNLALMTEFWNDEGEFSDWYYRRDPTHVCFYTHRCLRWIAENFGFKNPHFSGKRIVWFQSTDHTMPLA